MIVRSWTRRLREIRAVGGPAVGQCGRTVARRPRLFFGVRVCLVMTFNYPVLLVRVKGQG